MKPHYLNVALPVPLRRTFDYLPPTGRDPLDCAVGTRVKVPFGRQTLIGIIVGYANESEFSAKIKPAYALLDEEPIISGSVYKLCTWAAEYYHHALGEVLHSAVPVLLRQGRSAETKTEKLELLVEPEPLKLELSRAPRQRALVQALGQGPQSREDLSAMEFGPAIIKGLVERGVAAWIEHDAAISSSTATEFGPSLELNREQADALNNIEEPGTYLLFGVTGSGKTEVYLQAIERVVKAGKQALVLVPEIGLTPQTISRFEQRFPGMVVAMHSAMTNTDRLATWRRARSGAISVIVGTRSAIFSPLLNPGLIVVDEEHDASFKQQEGFRYSARDLAVKRGQLESVPVILGSATPALETFTNANSERYTRIDLKQRANDAQFAQFQIIGTEHQTLTEGFSPQLVKMMNQHLDAGNQVLVFLNRRGFAPVLHCRDCGWLSNCARCDGRMTYHLSNKTLICHHCENQHRAPQVCPECSSRELVPLGLGTQRLEHGLKQLFPNEHIVRIDRDTTRKKGELKEKLAEVNAGERCILLGTQLLAKGHHFPDVTLVAIVDLDSGLYSSDYHAIERMGQLLMQVGGRAGRGEKPGTVAIQTHYPDQPMLQILTNDGYEAFCEELLTDRQAANLPPYSYQAIVRAEAAKAGNALNFLDSLTKNSFPNVELLGPIPAPMEKRAGKYRAQLLVSSNHRGRLHQAMRAIINLGEQTVSKHNVRWSVDIDPYDLY